MGFVQAGEDRGSAPSFRRYACPIPRRYSCRRYRRLLQAGRPTIDAEAYLPGQGMRIARDAAQIGTHPPVRRYSAAVATEVAPDALNWPTRTVFRSYPRYAIVVPKWKTPSTGAASGPSSSISESWRNIADRQTFLRAQREDLVIVNQALLGSRYNEAAVRRCETGILPEPLLYARSRARMAIRCRSKPCVLYRMPRDRQDWAVVRRDDGLHLPVQR